MTLVKPNCRSRGVFILRFWSWHARDSVACSKYIKSDHVPGSALPTRGPTRFWKSPSQYPEPTDAAGCVTRRVAPTIGSPRAERPAFGLRLLTRWHATIRVSDIFIAPGDATRGRAACGHACGPQVTTRTTPALAETETTICTHAQPITKTRHAPLTTRRSGSACWPPVRRSSSGSILPTAQAGVSCQQGEGCERCCARIAGRKQCRHS